MGRVLWFTVIFSLLGLLSGNADDTGLIEALENKLKAVESQRKSQVKEMKVIDRKISSLHHAIARVRADITKTTASIGSSQEQIDGLREQIERSRGHIDQMWVSLYKGSFIDMVNIACSRAEYAGYVQAIMGHYLSELEHIQDLEGQLVDARQRLDRAMEEQSGNLKDLEKKMQSLHAQRERKERLLASLSRESKSYSEEMKRLLERLDARSPESRTGIMLKKGVLPWPVKGKVLRAFGKYTQGGFEQMSNGIDIMALEGSLIHSIFPGKVVFFNWIASLGNTMILDHGNGYYSIYGHLQDALIPPGQDVVEGDPIAVLGQSGDAASPMLHFEIRFRDKPQDPMKWLLGD
ncbi:MAG TPA: hypothetical protein ENN34_11155 [Deltaproteobacteria bacterium]|nr:hypothetical protein [Deltaproteobacteria bacterium]